MDWKSTLNLPKTEFAMRADLAKREPAWLERWEKEGQYAALLAARKAAGAETFVLHDGPPYPTGGIHYGTVLNKVLKDVVVRSRLMMGKHAAFRPGWDCHGLPIEQQVEKELGGKRKDMPVAEFREHCRRHALKFVDVMRGEFKRLGCLGDWADPYLTLAPEYEATIVRQLATFARRGLLYRDKKPVHWCLTHRTALAEAEVEYAEHTSPSIYVRFPLEDAVAHEVLGGPAALVVWTTTPWTLPANLAVVANPALAYVAIPVRGELLIVARELADSFLTACGLTAPKETWRAIPAAELQRLHRARYRHPFIPEPRAADDFRLWFADHATLEAGTGLVHTAPGHGADDYGVGRQHGLATYAPVDDAGRFTAEVPRWAGQKVFEANPLIVAHLAELGALLNKPGDSVRHQYPCCWRCKNPVIFRGTEQWFAALDRPLGGEAGAAAAAGAATGATLRAVALDEIKQTRWIPAWGEDRIRGMIEARPDWCLSRQRFWGVPIPAFACRTDGCGTLVLRADIMDHVADVFAREGSNAWYTKPAAELLPAGAACDKCGGSALDKTGDIVDVWFESGVSWAAVCEDKLVPRGSKVDLYLEGSDQHRGWFHSALLTGAATRGQAPYRAVLTHGWVLDERGKVYSKSEIARARAAGAKLDYVDPIDWMQKNGAEMLRLWAAAADYQRDVVFSKTIIDQIGESYRKVRNTCRYLLSNLYDFAPSRDAVHDHDLRNLDRAAYAALVDRDNAVWRAYGDYAFHDVVRLLVDYCVTVSAEYLDPVKDALYCEAPGSPTRRSVQTVLHHMTQCLATWMAPILCFTAQDVADELGRVTGEPFDVHGAVHEVDAEAARKASPTGLGRWWTDKLRPRREEVLKNLEAFRAAGHKSLEARVTVCAGGAEEYAWREVEALLPELCVVSQVRIESAPSGAGPATITVDEAPGPACPRCWRRTGEPSGDARDANLCRRCASALPAVTS